MTTTPHQPDIGAPTEKAAFDAHNIRADLAGPQDQAAREGGAA